MSERVLDERVGAGAAMRSSETAAAHVAARANHMMGCDVALWSAGGQAIAWEGLLEVARRLRRGAEEVLVEGFELTISMLGVTGRLSLAPERTLRQTAVADAMGLSLSRVSRVIDLLEQRNLVARGNCPADARATNVTLTRQGADLTARAQRELFAFVQSNFFDHLDQDEVQSLATTFTHLLNRSPPVPLRAR